MLNARLPIAGFLLAVLLVPMWGVARSAPPEAARLKALAEHHEQAGRAPDAAAAYEELVRLDPSLASVLAGRLVKLYVATQQPEPALRWAREVMKGHPDPQPYLAAVYADVGGYREAEGILRKELQKTRDLRRRVILNWQLSDVYARQKLRDEARACLEDALRLADGTPDEAAALRRLGKFLNEGKIPAPANDMRDDGN